MIEEDLRLSFVVAGDLAHMYQIHHKTPVHPEKAGTGVPLKYALEGQVQMIRLARSKDPTVIAIRLDGMHRVGGEKTIASTVVDGKFLHLHHTAKRVLYRVGLLANIDESRGPTNLGGGRHDGELRQVEHDDLPQHVDDHGARHVGRGCGQLLEQSRHPLTVLAGMAMEDAVSQAAQNRAIEPPCVIVHADHVEIL